ncbi:MAG: hypothetical protein ACW99G_12890 [Candidatus Thorarchaeota archaeon]
MNYLAYIGEFSKLKEFGFKRSNRGRQIWWPRYKDDRDEEIWVRVNNSNVAVNNRSDAAANLVQWIIDGKEYDECGWWSHWEEPKFERHEDIRPKILSKEEVIESRNKVISNWCQNSLAEDKCEELFEIEKDRYYVSASDLGYWHLRIREDTFELLKQLIDKNLVEIKDTSFLKEI